MTSTKIIIDTDIADDIDDAIALSFALGSPEFEIVGVTTVYGDVETRARVARKLLKKWRRSDIPVIPGAERPMGFDWNEGTAPEHCSQRESVADDREPLDRRSSAADFIANALRAQPGQLHVLTIGACTNVGIALCGDPSLGQKVRSVVSLAGLLPPRRSQPEWNVRYDPIAAASIARSGAPWTVIPADVQGKNGLTRKELDALAASGKPQAQFLAELIVLMARNKGKGNPAIRSIADVQSAHVADVITLVSFLIPEQMGFRQGWVSVDSRGGVDFREDAGGAHRLATVQLAEGCIRGEILRRITG